MRSKSTFFHAGSIMLVWLLTGSSAIAQMGQGARAYDPSTVGTLKGTVQDVQTGVMHQGQKGSMGQMGGTHLVLKTDKETLTVLVGPSSFLAEKNFTLAKGDQIEVTGSRVKYGDSDAIIAREIRKGDQVLTLRDERGVPEWSGGRQRNP